MAVLLLAPLSAFSASTDTHAPVASGSGSAHDADSHPHQPDCTVPASGQYFCCHLVSPGFQASGPVRSPDVDQPALAAHPAAPLAQKVAAQTPTASTHIPFTAPPRFILFGNFRS
ncbi:MAG: hypothetical protein Q8L40_06080 [Burkholderiales bacterium]|nr:hypothetical protein [Burkholderiales bacterium]